MRNIFSDVTNHCAASIAMKWSKCVWSNRNYILEKEITRISNTFYMNFPLKSWFTNWIHILQKRNDATYRLTSHFHYVTSM